ncbi:YncE family protein, partial [Acidobacteriota bacterium]
SLGGPYPIDAGSIAPLTSTLGQPDGLAFAPPLSPFGTNLFVGDIQDRAVYEIDANTGSLVDSTAMADGVEEVIFSNDGQTMFIMESHATHRMPYGGPATLLASGFNLIDALAQAPTKFGGDIRQDAVSNGPGDPRLAGGFYKASQLV